MEEEHRTKLPWEEGSEVTPQQGEKFNAFRVARLVYPTPAVWQNLIRDRLPETVEDPEDLKKLDFIRVVVDENGFVHWRWRHRVKRGNEIVEELRHQGGESGSDLDLPIRQIDRILDSILGITEDPRTKQRLQDELPEDETATLIIPKLSFRDALLGLQAGKENVNVHIPGRRDFVVDCINLVSDVLKGQTMPTQTQRLDVLSQRLERLQRVVSRKKTPPLELAASTLALYMTEKNSPNAIPLLLSLQDSFFDELRRTSSMTGFIVKRQVTLHRLRYQEEDRIGKFYEKIFSVIQSWQEALSEDEIKQGVRDLIHGEEASDLSAVITQPYRSWSAKARSMLDLEDALTVGDYELVSRRLNKASLELNAAERYTNTGTYGRPRTRGVT